MERTTTRWTCDRCGGQAEVSQGDQPLSWARIELVSPPRAEYDHKKGDHFRLHLCPTCKVDVRQHMKTAPALAVTA